MLLWKVLFLVGFLLFWCFSLCVLVYWMKVLYFFGVKKLGIVKRCVECRRLCWSEDLWEIVGYVRSFCVEGFFLFDFLMLVLDFFIVFIILILKVFLWFIKVFSLYFVKKWCNRNVFFNVNIEFFSFNFYSLYIVVCLW